MNVFKFVLIFCLSMQCSIGNTQIQFGEEQVLSFEDLDFVEVTGFFKKDAIPNWSTTATDEYIEVWMDGNGGVDASDGIYFVELNANENAALFFDIDTRNTSSIELAFDHRGRGEFGYDKLQLKTGGPDTDLEVLDNFTSSVDGWNTFQFEIEIPANQAVTRISFEAVETASCDPTIGNFLDNIRYTLIAACADDQKDSMFNMYPNPAVDLIQVESRGKDLAYAYQLISMDGKLLAENRIEGRKIGIDGLEAGQYLIVLLSESNTVLEKKLITKL